MNANLKNQNTMSPKQRVKQLIIDMTQSITLTQCESLIEAFIALDHAENILNELEKAHHIIKTCLSNMSEQQIINCSQHLDSYGISNLWVFRTYQRQGLIDLVNQRFKTSQSTKHS